MLAVLIVSRAFPLLLAARERAGGVGAAAAAPSCGEVTAMCLSTRPPSSCAAHALISTG